MSFNFNRREFLLALGTAVWIGACQSNSTTNNQQNLSGSLRIVALQWGFVESLLALGIQPVGVADIQGYRDYVNIPLKLADTVKDVGTRQEPNLEVIAQLQLDLILGVEFNHKGIASALEKIATTRLFQFYSEKTAQLTRLKEMFLEIANLTNHQEQGKQQLQQLETTLTEINQQLAQKGLTQRPIALAAVNDASSIRLFTDNALAIQLLNAIGLENAWEGTFTQFGFNKVGIETLTNIQDVNFIYVPYNQRNKNDITDHPVWEKLEFVQENRVYRLASDIWLYGGILSAERLVTQVRDRLTSS